MFEKIQYRYIIVKVDNVLELKKLKYEVSLIYNDKYSLLSDENIDFPNYIFVDINQSYIDQYVYLSYLSSRPNQQMYHLHITTNDKVYKPVYDMTQINQVINIIKTGKLKPSYKPKKRIPRTLEKTILRFNDFDNLEFRKGSLEYGDLVSKLLEFLRIYKTENDDKLVFNTSDFEKSSNIKIDEIIELNELPNKKSLYNFDIEVRDDKIIFTNLENKKSVHDEPVVDGDTDTELMIDNKNFGTDIRGNYTVLGVDDFYDKIGDDYNNPHLEYIEKCIEKIIEDKNITFNDVLDLGAGNGEVTNILKKSKIDNPKIIGCDPYLYKQYENNTGEKCLDFSFEDIHRGAIDHMKFDTIICSYSLHLCNESILPDLLWKLSLISNNLIIISPNNKPKIKKENGWKLEDNFKNGKSKCRIYSSKNINI